MGNSEGKVMFFKKGKKYLSGIDTEIKEEDIDEIYKIYDKNKDGVLQKEEASSLLHDVLSFYIKKVKEQHKNNLKESGGVLSESEEKKFNDATDLEKNLKNYLTSLFKKIDQDRNGTIDKKEFTVWFKEFSKNQVSKDIMELLE